MKKKIVLKLWTNDDKSRSKALKISVGISGVESVAVAGAAKDEVVVVGEGIDAVNLTEKIRKKVSYADLVSVGEYEKEQNPTKQPVAQPAVVWSYAPPYNGYYG